MTPAEVPSLLELIAARDGRVSRTAIACSEWARVCASVPLDHARNAVRRYYAQLDGPGVYVRLITPEDVARSWRSLSQAEEDRQRTVDLVQASRAARVAPEVTQRRVAWALARVAGAKAQRHGEDPRAAAEQAEQEQLALSRARTRPCPVCTAAPYVPCGRMVRGQWVKNRHPHPSRIDSE